LVKQEQLKIESLVKGSTGVLQRIYDTLNPSAETILSRLQESQKQEGEPIIKTQAYREEEAARTKLEEQLAKQLKAKNEANVADKINKITTDTTTIEVPEKSNARCYE
jgi:formate dehydrogenase maturation protein FdhE